MTYEYRFNETFGVYKWAIEFNKLDPCSVLYAHITGGKWKWLLNPETGKPLHTFQKEEMKPDLVAILRPIGVTLLGEGKKRLIDLYDNDAEKTMTKHVQIINKLSVILNTSNENWKKEDAAAVVIPTLLWCAEKSNISTKEQRNELIKAFHSKLKDGGYVGPHVMVALEVIKDENGHLSTNHWVYSVPSEVKLRDEITKFLNQLSSD